MKGLRPQRIRDPLHNIINFTDDLFDRKMWELIQTSAFQRLRRIKQLGFSDFVYPGATHTRFSHSLGVYYLAKKLLEIIQSQAPKNYNKTFAEYATVAALLHDIGHGPFSHAFEDIGKHFNFEFANHVAMTKKIIGDKEIRKILDPVFGSSISDNIANLIETSVSLQGIYGAVVSSQFDADRLDYIQRDRLMTGTQVSGNLDLTWLLSNLKIGEIDIGTDNDKGGKRQTFVLSPKALYAAQAYILGLFQLYPTVYFHKTTRGAEKIFTELMIRIFELVRDGNLLATNLPPNHPITLFAREPNALDRFMALDDCVLMGSLPLLAEASDQRVEEFAKRLLKRHFFKCIDVRERLRHLLCVNSENAGEINSSLELALQAVKNRVAELSEDKNCPCILEDSGSRVPYKKPNQEGGSSLEQILIEDVGGRIVDIATCSEVVSSLRPFEFYRVYVAPEAGETIKRINEVIEEQKKPNGG